MHPKYVLLGLGNGVVAVVCLLILLTKHRKTSNPAWLAVAALLLTSPIDAIANLPLDQAGVDIHPREEIVKCVIAVLSAFFAILALLNNGKKKDA